MEPDHRRTPAQVIGELLETHPEAASLLAEASHCRALAVCSAAITRLKLAAVQAARLAYEELRHRLEPRRRHPINFAVGLLLLLVLGAGLAMLDVVELSGLLDAPGAVLPALAAKYRVIRYDARGFGHSPAPTATFSLLRDLLTVLGHYDVKRAAIVGCSQGGGTALGLALEVEQHAVAQRGRRRAAHVVE